MDVSKIENNSFVHKSSGEQNFRIKEDQQGNNVSKSQDNTLMNQNSRTGTKYSLFFQVVDPSDKNKNRKVKCLLCSKILAYGNFHLHFHKAHERQERCKLCGKMFSKPQFLTHMKKCHPQ